MKCTLCHCELKNMSQHDIVTCVGIPPLRCPQNAGRCYLAPEASGLANAAAQRDPLLVERAKTHGDFVLNATISQKIKEAIAWGDVKGMKPVHREALDMIALKISRICSGQANYADHWDDIAGYAKLGSEATKP